MVDIPAGFKAVATIPKGFKVVSPVDEGLPTLGVPGEGLPPTHTRCAREAAALQEQGSDV